MATSNRSITRTVRAVAIRAIGGIFLTQSVSLKQGFPVNCQVMLVDRSWFFGDGIVLFCLYGSKWLIIEILVVYQKFIFSFFEQWKTLFGTWRITRLILYRELLIIRFECVVWANRVSALQLRCGFIHIRTCTSISWMHQTLFICSPLFQTFGALNGLLVDLLLFQNSVIPRSEVAVDFYYKNTNDKEWDILIHLE